MITLQRAPREQLSILFDRNFTDLMKFVACVMVAMSHYSGYAIASLGQGNIFYKIISSNCGYLGVAFFFLLSGYGLMMSEKKSHLTFVSFIKKRLSRTYLPAVLVSVLWLGANLVLNEIGGG